ncbi:MAG TPA: hypothetical protein VJV23_11845 [Candidatus Polarisedimenticolia bacterium]|nr:hypothetical protein [Candidatus Polarisedimenticolia bacterium]
MPSLPSSLRRFLAPALILPGLALAQPQGDNAADPVNAAGYEIDLASLPSPHPRPQTRPGQAGAGWVMVTIPWELVEKVPGQLDWSVADGIVRAHAEAGFRIVLAPRAGNPVHPAGEGEEEEAWSAFLRALCARYRDAAQHVMIGEGSLPVAHRAPREAAYWIKVSAVAVQAAAPGARVILGGLDAGRDGLAAFLEALYAQEIAVYLEALAVRSPGPGPFADLRRVALTHDPSAGVWWVGRALAGGRAQGGRLLRAHLEGVQQELALSVFQLDPGPEGTPLLLPELERIAAVFTPSLTPLVESGRGLQLITPMGQPMEALIVRLFDADAKIVLIAYDAGEEAPRGSQAVLAVDSIDLADPLLKDVAAGEEAPLAAYQKDDAAGVTRLAVPLAGYPIVLQYRRFTTPLFAEEERLEVTEKRLPSVEEILARHQAFQAAQDALLVNLRADARIDYHFRLGSGSTVDVTVTNSFYLDPRTGPEFEQKEFYVNGVRWRSNRLPEFPLPQPEKVLALPLDIALDKRYVYRLDGEETIGEYHCWVVAFEPLAGDASLYKGRVWIDKATHARVQIASLQTGLQPPITSNDETDSYRPVRGPEGLTYWLLSRIQGQQVFSTSGRNLVLVRDVAFSGHVVNDPGFEELRRQAYASDHAIVRDTAKGQRYLERTPDGGRRVKERLDPDNLFLLGGVFHNRSLDFPIPLAGVNYFNRDLGGKGIQTNVFFGGVLLFANASHPDLFGAGFEGSLDLFGQGFSSTDRPVREGREIDEEGIDVSTQRVQAGLGLPFADHWKVKWTAALELQNYARDEETGRGFLVPTDTLVRTAGMQAEFNRRAWSVSAELEASDRSRWEPWGFSGNPEFSEDAKDHVRYRGSVAKDFFLPLNQKIHASIGAAGGGDLDRFSKYRFDYFGNRLRGFGGAGLRYTNGAKAQLQYAFNLGSLVRFEATVDHARVKDREDRFDDPGEFRSFTGAGISGQTIVGPNLIVTLDWGIAVASDVRTFRGDQEILVTLLRLF